MCGGRDGGWTAVKHTFINMALRSPGCHLLWDGWMFKLVFLVFKAFILSVCICKAWEDICFWHRCKKGAAFTDPAETWVLTRFCWVTVGTLGNPYSSPETHTWKLLCLKPLSALVSASGLMREISPSALLSALWNVVFLILSFYLQFLLS